MIGASDILNKEPEQFETYLFVILALVIPGMAHIYATNHGVFISSWSQLISILLLSVYFSLPLFLIGWITVMFLLSKIPKKISKQEGKTLPATLSRARLLVGSVASLLVYFISTLFVSQTVGLFKKQLPILNLSYLILFGGGVVTNLLDKKKYSWLILFLIMYALFLFIWIH